MTIDYNYIDAYKIERAFFAIGKGEKLRPKQLRQMQAAFLTVWACCLWLPLWTVWTVWAAGAVALACCFSIGWRSL